MFDQLLDKYRQAASQSIQKVAGSVGVPLIDRDEHLRAIRNMSEQDLNALAQEFGPDKVAEYIQYFAGGQDAIR